MQTWIFFPSSSRIRPSSTKFSQRKQVPEVPATAKSDTLLTSKSGSLVCFWFSTSEHSRSSRLKFCSFFAEQSINLALPLKYVISFSTAVSMLHLDLTTLFLIELNSISTGALLAGILPYPNLFLAILDQSGIVLICFRSRFKKMVALTRIKIVAFLLFYNFIHFPFYARSPLCEVACCVLQILSIENVFSRICRDI